MDDNGYEVIRKEIHDLKQDISEINKKLAILHVGDNSWFAWSKSVLKELEINSDWRNSMNHKLNEIEKKLERLDERFKIRSGIWGALGGAIPAIAALIIWFVKTQK